MPGFHACPSLIWCLICLLATIDCGQAFLFSSSKHAHNETVENNYVDPQLLKTRNGVTSGKKAMFITKAVFVPRGIRHLFYDIDGNPLLSIPDERYEEVTVCTGRRYEHKNMRVLVYNNFVCPDTWDPPLASYDSLLNEGSNANIYCCRKPSVQDCCDKKRFYLIHGSLKVTNMEIIAILVGCMIFLAIIAVACICCLCSCNCVKSIFKGKDRQKTTAKGPDGSQTAAAKDYGATGYYKPVFTSSGSDSGPPGPGYGQSVPGYDPSKAGYDPSKAGYDPSKAGYDPSKAGYDPSKAGYDPSKAGYDPSKPEYDASKPGYGSPGPRYGSPGPVYGSPGPVYGSPGPGYGQPGPVYGPPGPGYGSPGPGYGPPGPGHSPPGPGYSPPGPGHGPPGPGYGPPGPGYGSPGPGYGSPGPGYGPTGSGYAPPGPGYEQSGPGHAQPEPTGIYGQPASASDPSGPTNGQGGSGPIYNNASRPASPNPDIYDPSTEGANIKK